MQFSALCTNESVIPSLNIGGFSIQQMESLKRK